PFLVNPVTNVLITSTAAARNNCRLPESMVYNKTSNPTGIRCTGADNAVSIFGLATDADGKTLDPKRARTTTDNTGVQYGLAALKPGATTAEEFVVVNEQAGGLDADAEFSTARSAGDATALATAYKSGVVSDGAHLAKTAILDLRGYNDGVDNVKNPT